MDPNGHHVENTFKKFYGDMCILGDKKLAVTSVVVYISKYVIVRSIERLSCFEVILITKYIIQTNLLPCRVW